MVVTVSYSLVTATAVSAFARVGGHAYRDSSSPYSPGPIVHQGKVLISLVLVCVSLFVCPCPNVSLEPFPAVLSRRALASHIFLLWGF